MPSPRELTIQSSCFQRPEHPCRPALSMGTTGHWSPGRYTGSACGAEFGAARTKRDPRKSSHRTSGGESRAGSLPATLSGLSGQWMKVRSVQRWSKDHQAGQRRQKASPGNPQSAALTGFVNEAGYGDHHTILTRGLAPLRWSPTTRPSSIRRPRPSSVRRLQCEDGIVCPTVPISA